MVYGKSYQQERLEGRLFSHGALSEMHIQEPQPGCRRPCKSASAPMIQLVGHRVTVSHQPVAQARLELCPPPCLGGIG